ncbi:hypothetical protein Golob_025077 [Gossypium lobatum]|uniref:Uncharacterized protein n=1 Tax=Gossypium lobatum TaxID=34289 RepID=A0A7J8NGU5_9ROSI|nr:hypothetical protein [Gossypium lobatum]
MWRFRLGSSTQDMRSCWICSSTCIEAIWFEVVFSGNSRKHSTNRRALTSNPN